MTFRVNVVGEKEALAAIQQLSRRSPAGMRRAVNRTIGVARVRVIEELSRLTGLAKRVLGGRRGRTTRDGDKVKGAGNVKHVKARGRRSGSLVVLSEGVRFSRTRRKRIGNLATKPGGQGEPFPGRMPSGHASQFQRSRTLSRVSPDRRPAQGGRPRRTRRFNLPIREVVIPIENHALRVVPRIMRLNARRVLPAKVWEELQKLSRRRRR